MKVSAAGRQAMPTVRPPTVAPDRQGSSTVRSSDASAVGQRVNASMGSAPSSIAATPAIVVSTTNR